MTQIKDYPSPKQDNQQIQPTLTNKQHLFDVEQWEADMKILAEGAEKIPVLPAKAFTRDSIYGNHE
jgi:hypothetical protein